MTEKYTRHYPRIASKNAVLVKKLSDWDPVEGFANTKVVGLGGCLFESDESLGNGSYLNLTISVEPGAVANAFVRVVYEHKNAIENFDIGVEFLEISDEHRKLLEKVWVHSHSYKQV